VSEIAVEIFHLDGRRVRRLTQEGRARAYRFAWDGRDQDGRIVVPGLYLYKIRVVEEDGGGRFGALVVAY
jgi:flagellar hook assembly protein FlgD